MISRLIVYAIFTVISTSAQARICEEIKGVLHSISPQAIVVKTSDGKTVTIDPSQEETLDAEKLRKLVGKAITVCVAHSHYKTSPSK